MMNTMRPPTEAKPAPSAVKQLRVRRDFSAIPLRHLARDDFAVLDVRHHPLPSMAAGAGFVLDREHPVVPG
jgi:hypothetical protein